MNEPIVDRGTELALAEERLQIAVADGDARQADELREHIKRLRRQAFMQPVEEEP